MVLPKVIDPKGFPCLFPQANKTTCNPHHHKACPSHHTQIIVLVLL